MVRFNGFFAIMKEVPIATILNNLSTEYLIKLILYENNVRVPKFQRNPV